MPSWETLYVHIIGTPSFSPVCIPTGLHLHNARIHRWVCYVLMRASYVCVISANDIYGMDHRSPVRWQRGTRCALWASLHPSTSCQHHLPSLQRSLRPAAAFRDPRLRLRRASWRRHPARPRHARGSGPPRPRYTRRRPEPTCWVIMSCNPSE